MLGMVRNYSLVGLVAGTLALGGCATQDSVEHAQATADKAVSDAGAAATAAQHAQASADQAGQKADQIASDLRALSTKIDSREAAEDAARAAQLRRWKHHRHHHRHHTRAAHTTTK